MRLTAAQIAYLAREVGWRGDDLVVAVALALTDSAGDPGAWTERGGPGGWDMRGLWQLDTRAYPTLSARDLFDPRTNAQAAYALWKRHGGFAGWAPGFAGQRYLAWWEAAQEAAARPAREAAVTDVPAAGQLAGVDRAAALDLAGAAGEQLSLLELPGAIPGDLRL